WGMIAYEVPLSTFPDTYNGQPLMFAALASQKKHMSLYLTCAYGDKVTERFLRDEFKARGLKLDMGKSCIRFKSLDELPLDIIGKVIKSCSLKDFLAFYAKAHQGRRI